MTASQGGASETKSEGADRADRPEDHGALWSEACDGAAHALDALSDLIEGVSSDFLGRKGVSGGWLADVVQDVHTSVFAYLKTAAPPPRNLPGFVRYRAWGCLSRLLRSMPPERRPVSLDNAPDAATGEHGPWLHLERKELRDALRECRRRLRESARKICELRYDHGLSSAAIGARMGITENAVNIRVCRANQELRQCLRAKGVQP